MTRAIQVLRTVSDVEPAAWDAFAAGRPFAQHRHLLAGELMCARPQAWYLLVRDAGRITAAAVGVLEHRLHDRRLDRLAAPVLRRRPYLRVVMPVRAEPGVLAPDGAGEAGLLDVLRGQLRPLRIPFCVIDNLPEAPTGAGPDDATGYRRLAWWPQTRLDIGWSSFDEYLAALPRKKRKEIRRIERRAQLEGLTVEPLPPADRTTATARELDRLVGNVRQQHGALTDLAPDLFGMVGTVLGDDLVLLVTRRADRVVGCVGLVRHEDDLVARWIGRDYEQTEGTAAYPSLVAACVRTAIALGVRRLHLGSTAYATKRQFGVVEEPRSRLLAVRNPIVRRALARRPSTLRSTAG